MQASLGGKEARQPTNRFAPCGRKIIASALVRYCTSARAESSSFSFYFLLELLVINLASEAKLKNIKCPHSTKRALVMRNTMTKPYILLIALLTVSTLTQAQFPFSTLTKFIRQDYDDLDNNLSKQGYTYYKENDGDKLQAYIWINAKTKTAFSILVQQDTISLFSDDNTYQGYSNINKYGLTYLIYSATEYQNLITTAKNLGYKKVYNKIENSQIISEYEGDDFYVDFIKDTSEPDKINYTIRILDKSYEPVDATMFENLKVKFKHGTKRMKPFTD